MSVLDGLKNLPEGLIYHGTVTAVPGANQFTIPELIGLGAGKFAGATNPYQAFVLRDAGGASAAPQGEAQAITAYVTATGVFTTAAFTAAVAAGDEILIVPQFLAGLITVLADLAVPGINSAANVLERDVIGNKGDTVVGTSIVSLSRVPAADAVTNSDIRDVVGNKADGSAFTIGATTSLMGYLKALFNSRIIAIGNLTTSSATVPADAARGEANDYWNGCLLMTVTGAVAFQPRRIVDFANAGGVFTLDPSNPWTAVPGLVFYVILANQIDFVPGADGANNRTPSDVIGNKTDTELTGATTNVDSAMRYRKRQHNAMNRVLLSMDFWSLPQEEVAIPAIAADQALPDITVADFPAGATVVRAYVMFKFRIVENTNAVANKLSGAQEIQIRTDAPGAWTDAINFLDNMFGVAAGPLREGGDVIIGAIDVAATVTGNDTYNLQWDEALADLASINFNDVQVGLRILYSV